MCLPERNTDRRGRPLAVRRIEVRTRCLRRLWSFFDVCMALLLLAFLAQHDLVGVLHALALVGLGRTVAADLRRHLTDLLDVGAAARYSRWLGALVGDALRNGIEIGKGA